MTQTFRAVVAFLVVALFALALSRPAAAVEIKVVTAKSGVTAWLVQDKSAPIIHLSLSFRGGAVRDPAGKEGLANMLASLLDEGAGELDNLAFQKRIEDLSITLSFSAGRDSFSGTVRTLTRHRDEAFRLLGLALTQPRFEADSVERVRAQLVSQARREARNPNNLAVQGLLDIVFAGHPYRRPTIGTEATIAAISVDDLKSLRAAAFGRDNLIVAVVGDISPEELAALLDRAFAGLPEKSQPFALAEAAVAGAGQVSVRRLPFPQSVVMFGHEGLKREDPDFYAATVLNHVLGGGGFSSRLYAEVREKRGLAYGIYTYLSPFDRGALYLGNVGTQNARVKETIDIVRAEWKRMAEGGMTQAELDAAITYLTGSWPLRFASPRDLAAILVSIQHEKLGRDYIDKRNDYIRKVTLADVNRVARRLLKAERLTFAVVGDPAGL
jgi:zinc protease